MTFPFPPFLKAPTRKKGALSAPRASLTIYCFVGLVEKGAGGGAEKRKEAKFNKGNFSSQHPPLLLLPPSLSPISKPFVFQPGTAIFIFLSPPSPPLRSARPFHHKKASFSHAKLLNDFSLSPPFLPPSSAVCCVASFASPPLWWRRRAKQFTK